MVAGSFPTIDCSSSFIGDSSSLKKQLMLTKRLFHIRISVFTDISSINRTHGDTHLLSFLHFFSPTDSLFSIHRRNIAINSLISIKETPVLD
jgi:hypothetical protein